VGRKRTITLAVVVALLAAVPTARPAPAAAGATVDWPRFHGTADNRGFNRFETEVGAANVGNLSLSWIGNGATTDPDIVFRSSPAVAGGFVYFGTELGQLLAFPDHCRESQCDPAWRVDLPQSIYDTPAVVDGVLYVGTASRLGRLYAFDVAACLSGRCAPLWTGRVAVGESSPNVVDGVVYVGSQLGGVYAFAAGGCGGAPTCDPLWVGQTEGYVLGSPAVVDGVVYAGASDGKLYAFDAGGCGAPTCRASWTGRVGGPIYTSSPAVAGGVVYVGSFGAAPNSHLNAFAAAGCGRAVCDPLWRGTGGHYIDSSPAVAYHRVYIGSGDGTLLVYPAGGCGQPTCAPNWVGEAAGTTATTQSPPSVANGVVYVGENDGRVFAFPAAGCRRSPCRPSWEFITQDPLVNSSPVMVNGTLYVSGSNFSTVPILYVFDLVPT
jgi:outer membrane protein assembly factor BamB